MKNSQVIKPVIFLLAAMSFGALSAQAADEYGFVNVAMVFDKYQKTVDNDKLLQEAGKKKETDRDALVSEIRQLKDELVLLTDDAKTKKQENLDGTLRKVISVRYFPAGQSAGIFLLTGKDSCLKNLEEPGMKLI